MKIPVGATARAAYGFTIRNYFRLLGVGWAPLLLTYAAMWWLFFPFIADFNRAQTSHDPALLFSSFSYFIIFEAIAVLMLIVIATGVARLALGHAVRWPILYLPSGGDFGRLLLSCVLIFSIMVGVFVGLGIVAAVALGVAAASGAGAHPDPAAIRLAVARYMPAVIAFNYALLLFLAIRLGFMLPAIVIEEKRLGLGRNWMLSRGNFWRLLGLLFFSFLPLLALSLVQNVALAMLGPDYNILSSFRSPAAQMAWSQSVMTLFRAYWYIALPVAFLLAPFFNGPLFATGAFAYRALVPKPSVTEAST